MIETEGIPNWRRWQEKEQSGVNRGYPQAYINTQRGDHFVLISKTDLGFKDECRVTATPCDHGNWKSSNSNDAKQFEGTPDEADELLAEAEEYARKWMLDHPCEREGERDAVELLTDLFAALQDQGLEVQHDASVDGWLAPHYASDSTSHNIRPYVVDDEEALAETEDPRKAEVLGFHIKVDGKQSGLSYHESKEVDSDGEVRRKHEPMNQSKLHSNIAAAFRELGFEDPYVENGGYQTHWDHATSYTVRVFIPEDFNLELPAPDQNQNRQRRGLFG